jgi:hypothetical protein
VDKSTASSSPSKAVVVAVANDAAPVHLERNVLLLSKLLDLESPCLTEKMIVSHTHMQHRDTTLAFFLFLLAWLLCLLLSAFSCARVYLSRMNGCRPSRRIFE